VELENKNENLRFTNIQLNEAQNQNKHQNDEIEELD
jgi:hypothetical protein